ncbi:MAG: hypothetical protein JWM10_1964 [Myxococcaceae bacterium]|nr:hypothetical protein [Myxococcaceae bacterium]
MPTAVIAPYGTWRSAVNAERVAAGVRPVSAPCVAGGPIESPGPPASSPTAAWAHSMVRRPSNTVADSGDL